MEQKRIPIRKRILRVALATTVGALAASVIISMICMFRMESKSEDALTGELQRNLLNLVESKTQVADARFEHYMAYIDFIGDFIQEMYAGKDILIKNGTEIDFPRSSTAKNQFAMQMALCNENLTIADVKDDRLLFSHLEKAWKPIAERNDGLISTVYVGTESGLMASYDKYSYLSGVPDGEQVFYDYKTSGWYERGRREDRTFLTGLYTDSQGRGLTITIAKSFCDEKKRFAGVSAADFDITGLYDQIISMDIGEGAFSFTVDKSGDIISPDGKDSTELAGLSESQFSQMLSGKKGILATDEALIAYAPVKSVDWLLCAYVPKTIISDGIRDTKNAIHIAMLIFALATVAILFISAALANRTVRTITTPIERLGEDMEKIAQGDLQHRATAVGNDEIGDTARRLNTMVERLLQTTKELFASQTKVQQMSDLANKDALTGIRNKTAYDKAV